MGEFPTLEDIFEPIEGKSGTEANEQMRRWYTGTRQLPGGAPPAAITIVDDAITPTSADVVVDTEGQAPADNLQIIQTSSTHDGMILSLRAANPDRVVTVLATGQLNGITLWNRAERYVLSTTESIVLQRDGNWWHEVRGAGAEQLVALDSRVSISQQILHVRDEKAYSAGGGAFTSGAWRTRDLNTIVANTIDGASLASNSFTLPAGTYDIMVSAPAQAVNKHVIRLINDAGIVSPYGQMAYAYAPSYGQSNSNLFARITVAQSTIFTVQHVCETTGNFGVNASVTSGSAGAVSIFTEVIVRRIA